MRNEVIFDSRGIPDIMVVFTPDELGLPAEIKGKAVKEYAISKYPNTLIEGVPYSLPYQQPAVNINHDEAIRLCEAKGPGWHLLTNDEWAALAHQSRKNGTLPRGNTDCGKSHSYPEETGTTYRDGSGDSKTLTGSGPITWNHDHTAEGVADMCGNIFEHVGGIRFLNGQVQVIPNNEAAAGADQSKDSKEWTPIYTANGDTIFYNVEDGEIKLQPVAPDGKDYDGVPFVDLDGSALEVPEKLIELGLYPTSEDYNGRDYFWLDTDGERIVIRGGGWLHGADAGVFSFAGYNSRAVVAWGVGFRSALIRYSGDSGDLDNLDGKDSEPTDEPREETAAPSFDTLPGPVQLPTLVRLILARQLTVLYEAAGGKDPEGFKRIANTATEAPEPTPEPTQLPAYVFIYGEGYPVNMQAMTDAWATEAGFEKRYIITDEERYELASAITAEAIGEPFAGKVAVAQCILQACEDDGIRPIEALTKYKYSTRRPEPTDEALAAVAAVFDFGHVATNEPIKYFYAPDLVASLWHESQVYVMTINNHRFFKEVQHGQGNQEPDRSCD